MKARTTILAAALLLAYSGAMALSLGRPRGNVLLGQPLDLAFEVRYEGSPDESAASCLNVEVFQGDVRMDPSRLRLAVEPGPTPGEGIVRLRSNQTVDEAVLSVVLRAGCNANATRRYDFLVDFPNDTRVAAAPAAPVVVAPAPAAVAVTPGAAAAVSAAPATASAPLAATVPAAAPSRAAARPSSPRPSESRPAPRAPAPRVAAAPAPRAAPAPAPVVKASPPVESSKARLVLTPAEGVGRRDSALKSSTQLAESPAVQAAAAAVAASGAASVASAPTSPERAQAQALWSALNADPADMANAAKRANEAEAANRQLREQMARSQAQFNQLMSRMEQLEAQRTDPLWLYGLGGLALLGFGAAGALWMRQRRTEQTPPRWWQEQGPGAAEEAPRASRGANLAAAAADDDGVPESIHASIPGRAGTRAALDSRHSILADRHGVEGVDVDVSGGTVSQFDRLSAEGHLVGQGAAARPTAPAAQAKPAGPAAAPASQVGLPSLGGDVASVKPKSGLRAIDPEDLFDLQQHADFFVSLGQYDQAIDVLRKHISENETTSPLAYLDLLKIYHTLSRTDEFNKLRARFQIAFNARVPAFNAFNDEGRSLDEYPDAVSDIQALWPSLEALHIIEDHLFRTASGDGESYDLAAYRDLLMLYSLARSVMAGAQADDVDATQRRSRLGELRQARAASITATRNAGGASDSGIASMSAALAPMGAPVSAQMLKADADQSVESRAAPSYVDIDLDLGEAEAATPPVPSKPAGPAADEAYEASILAGPSVALSRKEMPASPLDDLDAAATPLPEVSLPTNFSSLGEPAKGPAPVPPLPAVPSAPALSGTGDEVGKSNLIDFNLDDLAVAPVKKQGPPQA